MRASCRCSLRERALDELKAIDTANLIHSDPELYCARVSATLRHYLARGCRVDVTGLSMGELSRALDQKHVPANIASQIVHVLRVSEGVLRGDKRADLEAIHTLTNITQQIVLLLPPKMQA